MRILTVLALASSLAACQKATPDAPPAPAPAPTPGPAVAPKPQPAPVDQSTDGRMYTTYFYTAGEAVIHGYAADTHARVVAITDPGTERKAGTIWSGSLNTGETKIVRTGPGVFGLLSDKKASILVGTPSSCAVVGYFLKDEEGRFLSTHFFTQLPSSAQLGGERVVVWAYEDADVEIRVPSTQKVLAKKSLKAGGRLELDGKVIGPLGDKVVEVASTGHPVSVEVYYDEGFIVPSREGRGTGTDFYAFVGALTAGTNDLDVVAIDRTADVHVTDVDSGKEIWTGKVAAGAIHTDELANRYVHVTSDAPIEVMVAAFEHNGQGYAEHHFATGREGGGIDTDFELTTSSGLWLFSYFAGNAITVTEAKTQKVVYTGTLGAGTGHELQPGGGLYRVHATKGASVMGGANACGADYSPAAGMFAVDDDMLQVIQQVTDARIQTAKAQGVTLTPAAAAAAPMTPAEWEVYGKAARAHGYSKMSADEANERLDALKQK